MELTAFDLFFLPLFRGFAFWLLVMVVVRLLLDMVVWAWAYQINHDQEALGLNHQSGPGSFGGAGSNVEINQ